MLTHQFGLQSRNALRLAGGLSAAGTAPALKGQGGVLKKFLLPAVEHGGMYPVLLADFANGYFLKEMEPKDPDFFLP